MGPSVTASDGDQEGIPVVLMEGLALGLPVISTYHSGIPELIENGKTGYLVPERDVDALYQKLKYLILRPETWHKIGRAGRRFVKKYYEINNLNDQLVNIYQRVIYN